jgi:undecaprenyl-diphosphatase
MLETLLQLDYDLFLFFNDINSPFWDKLMLFITHKYTWVPLYLGVTIYLFYRYKLKSAIFVFLGFILLVFLTDQSSVHLFKNVFERLRPSHDPLLEGLVHNPGSKGGKYGFVSSHASNVFGFAVFSALLFKNRLYSLLIFIWAIVVSYSRIYLGVHFPGDILGGALLGTAAGFAVYAIFLIPSFKIQKKQRSTSSY